jgi:endonuclease YncB( thermonuclease family)
MSSNVNSVLGNHGINTPVFNLRGLCQICRVVDIVDGDTVYVVFAPFGIFYKFKTRLLGINTPELSRCKIDDADDDKINGLNSYLYTITQLHNYTITQLQNYSKQFITNK